MMWLSRSRRGRAERKMCVMMNPFYMARAFCVGWAVAFARYTLNAKKITR